MHVRELCLAGSLAIALATVCSAHRIVLTTGETLEGNIVEQTDNVVTFEHPILGSLRIDRGHITAIEQAVVAEGQAQATGEAAVQTPAPPETPPDAGRMRLIDRWLAEWESHFEIGLAGTEGNSQTANVRLAFDTRHERDLTRWTLDTVYYYSSSTGDTTRNELAADLMREWLMPDSPWLLFAQGIYEFDQFQDWRHRVSGFGGAGYEFVKTDRLELLGRMGGGVAKELDGAQDLRPEGLLSAAVAKWKPTDAQTFSASVTLHPDLASLGEFRVISKLEWALKLNTADNLSLKLGLDNEYESRTDGDAKHNDLKYYGGLVIDF